nr:acylphosphatase-2 [Meriones unguiculatus]
MRRRKSDKQRRRLSTSGKSWQELETFQIKQVPERSSYCVVQRALGSGLPSGYRKVCHSRRPALAAQWPAAVFCGLPTRDPARWCRGAQRGASTQEPPSPRAAAASSPRTPPRMLARRLVAMAGPLKSVDYEVFGRVQGVCFRMYTEGEAKKRGVVGWVKNTSKGTVTGQMQGPEEKVDSMKSWLSKVGSPSSRIDRADFSNEKTISKLEYSDFSIRY